MENIEKEVKFLNVDNEAVQERLLSLGANDEGRQVLRDDVYYFPGPQEFQRWCRVRLHGDKAWMCYKDQQTDNKIDTNEIEFEVSDPVKAKLFLEKCGLYLKRSQEKHRHKFTYKNFVFDFDEWPMNAKFLEIEGQDEAEMEAICRELGLQWEQRVFGTSLNCLKEQFKIPVDTYKHFTFELID
ncbi:MAG TPA: CYTH domain-containing protein [Patescibacteria group bacterium]|nr:CYTH domain-containing protein [Patescibacteria group bacterium]